MEYNFIRKRGMDMSQQYFEEEVKHKIVKLHRSECQTNQELKEECDYIEENKRLKKELDEAKKEVAFLKKAAAFFAKEID